MGGGEGSQSSARTSRQRLTSLAFWGQTLEIADPEDKGRSLSLCSGTFYLIEAGVVTLEAAGSSKAGGRPREKRSFGDHWVARLDDIVSLPCSGRDAARLRRAGWGGERSGRPGGGTGQRRRQTVG